jgi:exonuclease III
MRIVSWNIRAGGGGRVAEIASQLQRWSPDVVGLCEFRATPPSAQLAALLAKNGLEHQLTTADAALPGSNALLLASRWPLRRLQLRRRPIEPRRWLATRVAADVPFVLGLMHAPNMVTGRKVPFLEAIEALAGAWRHGPAVFLGDTNCGWPVIDEERPVFGAITARWLDALHTLGWRDAFRHLRAEERFYTWYSPNGGNGFRLDQAFVNRRMLPRLQDACYEWGTPMLVGETMRREALSDHAALIVDFV